MSQHYEGTEPIGRLHPDDLAALEDAETGELGDELTIDFDPHAPRPAPKGIPAVIESTVTGEAIIAEVSIGGKPRDLFAKPPECPHLRFTQQVVIANLVDETQQGRPHVGWRAQLKIRCAECGVPFRFMYKWADHDPAEAALDAATSDDLLTLGAMIEPIPESERSPDDANWPAIGGTVDAGDWPVQSPSYLRGLGSTS